VSKECKEWLNISEIANILGCSRPTVYKRIDTIDSDTLQPLQHKDKGVTYYSYKIIDLLKEGSGRNTSPVDNVHEEAAADLQEHNYKDEYIQDLKADIDFLRKQLDDLNNRLAAEQELHRNTQVLFKQQQPQDIKALEAHQHEFDIKLSEMRDNMEKRQNEQNNSIFKRLFGKNK
jgi:DNA anti-recombination protein RmuC